MGVWVGGIRHVIAAACVAELIMLIIGILAMAGEFRHNTATATFLITPDRKRVLVLNQAQDWGTGRRRAEGLVFRGFRGRA